MMMKNSSNILHQRNFEHFKIYTGRDDDKKNNNDDDDADRCWLLSCGDNHDEIMMMSSSN